MNDWRFISDRFPYLWLEIETAARAARVGPSAAIPVLVTTLGSEALVGRNLIAHFRVILDHGQRLIVEP